MLSFFLEQHKMLYKCEDFLMFGFFFFLPKGWVQLIWASATSLGYALGSG